MTRRSNYSRTNGIARNLRGLILTYIMTRFRLGRTLMGCGCLLVAVVGFCALLAVLGVLRL